MNKFQNIRSYWNKPQHAAYLFILPAAILLIVFNVIPLLASFYISTLNMKISFDNATFVGLANYKEALTDARFLNII